MDEKYAMLRHFLAALAYRTQKAVRDAPMDFGDFHPGNQIRTPKELVCHMTSVLGYARTYFVGGKYWPDPLPTFEEEIARFHEMLEQLSGHLEREEPLTNGVTPEQMLQGPFSDAMTHAGQLAMLRRFYGDPVAPENFIVARVDPANLTANQPAPESADDVWPEAPDRTK